MGGGQSLEQGCSTRTGCPGDLFFDRGTRDSVWSVSGGARSKLAIFGSFVRVMTRLGFCLSPGRPGQKRQWCAELSGLVKPLCRDFESREQRVRVLTKKECTKSFQLPFLQIFTIFSTQVRAGKIFNYPRHPDKFCRPPGSPGQNRHFASSFPGATPDTARPCVRVNP